MQGSFPVGADWNSALNPANDQAVERKVRSDLMEKELAKLARVRNPAMPAPPNEPLLTYVAGPFPPTTNFRAANGDRFYVMNGLAHARARKGELGHYIVTTVVDAIPDAAGRVQRLSRPFLNPTGNMPDIPALPDAPGTTAGDPRAPPNPRYCVPFRDYITPKNGGYHEIGVSTLSQALEAAEGLDLAFARRMEGLGNVPASACWDCIDPDYDPTDRPILRDQFVAKYLARFYDDNEPSDFGPRAEDVADEAMDKHRALCQAWAKKHYRTLTPFVTGPAEALASEFYKYLEQYFPPNDKLTRVELARVLMRHPDTATEFAICLHSYSSALEQTRGGRNASYKAMSLNSAAKVASYKRLGDLLGERVHTLGQFFSSLADQHERLFHPYVVDWYAILGQMPQVHRFFDGGDALLHRPKRSRSRAARDHIPPWKFGKSDGA